MLTLHQKDNKFWYPIFWHPLPRVLKFERFFGYFQKLPRNKLVLDYGSGDRPYEKMLLTKFDKYLAADYPVTNQNHKKLPDIQIVDDSLDLPPNSVDCVVLTEVMIHLYEPKKVLQEIHRVLKPGGKLMGTVPFVLGQTERPHDYHRFTYFCLERMFRDTGFEIIQMDYVGDMLVVAISVMSRIFNALIIALKRARLTWVAYLLNALIKIPEYLYYYICKLGLNPQKIEYFKQFPVGFAFIVEKRISA